MLTQLRFKNFKAWKDSGPIRLAPLTVFFGANSAGKSSIPQLLLLLKQTAESPDRQNALQLGDDRTLVNLGTYADAVHNHDVTAPLEISLEWTLHPPLDINDPLSGCGMTADRINFAVKIGVGKRDQPQVIFMQYSALKDDERVLQATMKQREGGNKYRLDSTGYNLVRHQGRAWPLQAPVRFYGFPDEVIAYYQNSGFTADLVLQMERLFRSLFYVGPLREYPKRLYLWSGEVPDHVGVKGDRAVEAILAGSERRYNPAPREKKRSLSEFVASRLLSMGLIQSFKVQPLGEGRKEYEVLVRTNRDLPEVKLTDVGFGVSQVLPVIVECFYVPSRSIVFFEQPEIHLHPKVQAELANLFVDAIHAREGGAPRCCQFIIESHSEHFLRRLQRLIAEEKLKPEDAALYFVHIKGTMAIIEPLKVDEYGNILNWPDNFFGDEMADLVARSEAQASRMKRKGES